MIENESAIDGLRTFDVLHANTDCYCMDRKHWSMLVEKNLVVNVMSQLGKEYGDDGMFFQVFTILNVKKLPNL